MFQRVKFREDLYFKLTVIPFHLNPLRERGSDIQLLADYFLDMACSETGQNKKRFSKAAQNMLSAYKWPGNVRELKNIIERLCILVEGDVIDYDDLAPVIDVEDTPLRN